MLTLSVCMVRRTLREHLLSQAHSHRKVLLVPVVSVSHSMFVTWNVAGTYGVSLK